MLVCKSEILARYRGCLAGCEQNECNNIVNALESTWEEVKKTAVDVRGKEHVRRCKRRGGKRGEQSDRVGECSKSEVELSINFNYKNYKGWAEARQRRQARYKL